jgi:recombination protein RecA
MTNEAVNSIIKDIRKKYGEESASSAAEMPPMTTVHSGSLALDFALGCGGMPSNRVVEFLGEEGSGKTTAALLVAEQIILQQPERAVVMLDMEHKLTPSWVEKLMGDTIENLVVLNPDTIEQASDMMRDTVKSGKVSMVILDSIGGAPTQQVMDDERSAEQAESMGGNAKGVTKFGRWAANFSAKYNCLVVGINQQRDDLKSRHGNLIVTPGGRGWKHNCLVRIQFRKGTEKYLAKVNEEEVKVGFNVIARTVKNQAGGEEGRTAEWRFFTTDTEKYGPVGIDTTEECIRLATKVGVIVRAGAWYRHAALPDGQVRGMGSLVDAIRDDEALKNTIVSETMAALTGDDINASDISPIIEVDGETNFNVDEIPSSIMVED